MITNAPENWVLPKLPQLIDSARELGFDYQNALRDFQRRTAVGRLVADTALDYLEEQFDLDRATLDQGARTFFVDWFSSPEYRKLEKGLENLIAESRSVLKATYARPPKLSGVRQAVQLPTKARRLAEDLEQVRDEIQDWLSQGRQLPIYRVRAPSLPRAVDKTTRTQRHRSSLWTLLPKRWWEWLGIVGASIAFVVSLSVLFKIPTLESVEVLFATITASVLLDLGLHAAKPRS